ncbi:hypothetical protein AQI95_26140 [Streptomyces yokosukanensis]|uniref:Uncharacterized protein n=1 Tax=Streptomyces yokosukanensis TaxID=67386 RepID=A0A101NZS4_9ACTN|nr:hypothetical protein AQI95_26140 [Streptomyces yokosukanensis]
MHFLRLSQLLLEHTDFRAWMEGAKAARGKVRVALVGDFESRMVMWVSRSATSTHALPSPPPE